MVIELYVHWHGGTINLTCCLLLLHWRMTLQERMVEEEIKRHSFFSVATQKSEEKILEFWRRSNGDSEDKERRKD